MKCGRDVIFLANPDLVDIWGDMDLDFDIFLYMLWILNFWIFMFPDFQNLAGPGLGLGPGGPSGEPLAASMITN